MQKQTELLTKCRDILVMSIRSRLKASRSEWLWAIAKFFVNFREHSPKRIIFDDTAYRVILEHAIVANEKTMEWMAKTDKLLRMCIRRSPEVFAAPDYPRREYYRKASRVIEQRGPSVASIVEGK